jgi:hypothetical protein
LHPRGPARDEPAAAGSPQGDTGRLAA